MFFDSQTKACVAFMALIVLAACDSSASRPELPEASLIHVPEGTPELRPGAPGSSDERTALPVLEVSRLDLGAYDPQFSERWFLAASADGSLALLDLVASEVSLVAPDGTRRKLEGTDVLAEPIGVSTSGTEVVVSGLDAIALFGSDGRLQRTVEPAQRLFRVHGLPTGGYVGIEFDSHTLTLVNSDWTNYSPLTVLPKVNALAAPFMRHLYPEDEFVVGGDQIYVTPASTYEIAAFTLDGAARWLLRVPWAREPIPEEEVSLAMGRTRRAGRAMGGNVDAATLHWPTQYPALEGIAADARGRLYVFPFVVDSGAGTRYPVDVYSPRGELLVHGTLPFQGWDAAVDDLVYRIQHYGERSYVVTYRIELPDSSRTVAVAGAGQR